MRISGRDPRERPYLIAEIGNNHEGDLSLALDLVDAAAESGADAVKVQVIRPERLVHCDERERIEQLGHFALGLDGFTRMAERAAERGVDFMASAFDLDSLREIEPLCAALKIASGDLDFTPLLECAAATGKPLVLSTGMASLAEVRVAVAAIRAALPEGRDVRDVLALLHCVAAYPTPLAACNLQAIGTLATAFPGVVIGWSDHTLGIAAALVAAGLGARVIEKHFTLDRTRTTFRDHALSSDPAQLRDLAEGLYALDAALGDGTKRVLEAEASTRAAARRSIVAARSLEAGTRLVPGDLDFLRPAGGLSPSAAPLLVGRMLRVARKRHDRIRAADLTSEGAP